MATLEEQYAQRQAEAQQTYDQRQTENQNTFDQRQQEVRDTAAQRDVAAQQLHDQRQAEAQQIQNERDVNAQNLYTQRQQEAQALYDQRQQQAQGVYDQRMAEANRLYDERSAESQGKINSMFDSALESQRQQLKAALDQGIAAQEEARAGIAKSYQTGANDLAVQYERNRRNLNAQALARGLNTGTASQQQLAVNQGFMDAYGRLRGEEAAKNAAIDRQIANLKVNYQNDIARAIADNDYKKAAALLEDYKSQVAWLDGQRASNQNYLDTMSMNNQNRLDATGDQNRSMLDAQMQNNQNLADQTRLANQSRLDSAMEANRNYLDSQTANNQNRLDSITLNNQNRFDSTSDSNRNWFDTETRYQQQQAEEKAKVLASYGDFSGYAALYGQEQANAMRQMWIAQNPLLAYNTGAIDANRYFQMTGMYAPGTEPAASSGGGSGGGYYSPKSEEPEAPSKNGGKEYKGGAKAANVSSSNLFEKGYANSSTSPVTKTQVNAGTGFTGSRTLR